MLLRLWRGQADRCQDARDFRNAIILTSNIGSSDISRIPRSAFFGSPAGGRIGEYREMKSNSCASYGGSSVPSSEPRG